MRRCFFMNIALVFVISFLCDGIVYGKAERCLSGIFIEEKVHATLASVEQVSKKLSSQRLSSDDYASLPFIQQVSLIAHVVQQHPEIVFYSTRSSYYWATVGVLYVVASLCSFKLGKSLGNVLFKEKEWLEDDEHGLGTNDDPMVRAARAGQREMDVHTGDRDRRVNQAFKLLVKAQGGIEEAVIHREYNEFRAYVQAFADRKIGTAALRVMDGWRALYPDRGMMRGVIAGYLGGLNVTQMLARSWIFAKNHADNHYLRRAMVEAVARCAGGRCPTGGGGQELAVALLQGRLRGVNIDRLARGAQISGPVAMEDFFRRPAHRVLASRAAVLEAANKYMRENPLVKKEEFSKEINEYIRLQEEAGVFA